MSRPMLPGQNSKYWGYDLNNYLLSLENKISGLESFHQNQQTIVQNVGPGFHTGEWELITTQEVDGVVTAVSITSYTLTGKCSYETYVSGSIRSYVREFNNEEIFKEIYVVEYDSDGKLSYPNGTASIGSLPKAFYAVYLFFERSEDGNSDTVKTLFCKDYIFRGDCIMIGSYEKAGGIFTPRVQSSSKTLYQSGQDTIHSYATVEYGCSSDRLPLANSKDSNNIYDFKKFYYYSNGVSPSEILSSIKDSNEKFTNRSYDVFSQINNGAWKTYLVSEGDEISVNEWTGQSFSGGELAAYYLAPSGNIYIQIHAGPTNYPEVKDYNMEAVDPLRDKEGFVTGGLVFIGTVFKKEEDIYDWVSSASNGISPVLLDIGRINPHKILIENNEYWVGDTYYKIDITPLGSHYLGLSPLNKDLTHRVNIVLPDTHLDIGHTDYGNGDYLSIYSSAIYCQSPDMTLAIYGKNGITFNDSSDDNFSFKIFNRGHNSSLNHQLIIQTNLEDDEGEEYKNEWVFDAMNSSFNVDNLITKYNVTTNSLNTIGRVNMSNKIKIDSTQTNVEIDAEKIMIKGETTIEGETTITGIFSVLDTAAVIDGSLEVSGPIDCLNSITCKDITFISDIRLKTNLKPINSEICHNAVQNLNVNTYTYIRNNYDTLGLIAQEIEEQLPEYAHLLVHENEDGEKMVSEHKLLFILWEALKQEIKERKGGK